MIKFVLRRFLLIVPTLFGLVVLTFFLVRIVPADPAAILAGESATTAQIESIRQSYGLDKPLVHQFFLYLRQIASGDFGVSLYTGRPVVEDLFRRLPATLELAIVAMSFSIIVGVGLGVVAAVFHNRLIDFVIRIFTVSGLAVASFWFAMMLQLVFSMDLGWFPLAGRLSFSDNPPPHLTGFYLVDSLITGEMVSFWSSVRHLCLPAFTLSIAAIATIARFTRGGVLDTMPREFVTYERAVGYPRHILIGKYVLRNSIVATVSQIGLLFGVVISHAVVVEDIFNWPGIGSYVVHSILTADYQAILAVTLLIGIIYAVLNIAVDVVQGLIDPRVAEEM
jgi:peptide/nickel transport system permease protein